MLQLENVVVRYGRVTAVRGISLHVDTGELVGLVGPNGAGKSTTLATIMGFRHPSEGVVRLEGQPLNGSGPEQLARRGVSLVPEGRQIFTTLTVAENLVLGATVRRDRQRVQSDIEALLERFPSLRNRYHRAAGGLSGGEQQQLAIARALLSKPKLMLLDEPTLGLAPLMVDGVFDVLAALKGEGMTILLVEQNALRTVELADRTYVLRNGEITLEGTSRELMERADFAEHYLGV